MWQNQCDDEDPQQNKVQIIHTVSLVCWVSQCHDTVCAAAIDVKHSDRAFTSKRRNMVIMLHWFSRPCLKPHLDNV